MKSFIKRFEESVRSCWNQLALNDFRYDSITYGQLAVEIKTLHLLWEQAGLHPERFKSLFCVSYPWGGGRVPFALRRPAFPGGYGAAEQNAL